MTDIGNCFGNESLYIAFPYALNLKVYSFGPLWDLYRSVLDTIEQNLPHLDIHKICSNIGVAYESSSILA